MRRFFSGKLKRFLSVKYIIVFIILLSALYYYFGAESKNSSKQNAASSFEQPSRETFEILVTCTGVVSAVSSVDVKSRVGGTVEYLKLMEGDYVNKNDLVANIDKRNILLKVKQIETDLKSAKAQLEKARINYEFDKKKFATDLKRAEANASLSYSNFMLLKKGTRPEEISQAESQCQLARANFENNRKNYNRLKEVFAKNLVSQSSLDSAKAAMDANAAQLRNAEERVLQLKNGYQSEEIQKAQAQYEVSLCAIEDAKSSIESLGTRVEEISNLEATVEKNKIIHEDALEQLKDTAVLAPISGVVTQKWVDEGGIITSGISSVTSGTNIITLSDMGQTKIKANVDETDIHKLSSNLEARVKLDAFQKRIFKGCLSSIGPRVYLKDNVPVIDIMLDLLEGSGEVKVGMTADADIVVTSVPDALTVSSDSIIERGGKHFVKISKNNGSKKTEMRQIEIGESNGERTVVLSGIEENEQFLTAEALKNEKESNSKQLSIPLLGAPPNRQPGRARSSGGSSGKK